MSIRVPLSPAWWSVSNNSIVSSLVAHLCPARQMGLYCSIPSLPANAQAWLSNSLVHPIASEAQAYKIGESDYLSWNPMSSWPRLAKPISLDPARAPMCLSWNLTLWYPLILSPLSVVRVITIVVHQYNQIQEFKCLLFVHPIYLSHLPRRNVCNPKLRLTILAKCNIWILDVDKVTFWQQVAILYIWTLASDSSSIYFFMLLPLTAEQAWHNWRSSYICVLQFSDFVFGLDVEKMMMADKQVVNNVQPLFPIIASGAPWTLFGLPEYCRGTLYYHIVLLAGSISSWIFHLFAFIFKFLVYEIWF